MGRVDSWTLFSRLWGRVTDGQQAVYQCRGKLSNREKKSCNIIRTFIANSISCKMVERDFTFCYWVWSVCFQAQATTGCSGDNSRVVPCTGWKEILPTYNGMKKVQPSKNNPCYWIFPSHDRRPFRKRRREHLDRLCRRRSQWAHHGHRGQDRLRDLPDPLPLRHGVGRVARVQWREPATIDGEGGSHSANAHRHGYWWEKSRPFRYCVINQDFF